MQAKLSKARQGADMTGILALLSALAGRGRSAVAPASGASVVEIRGALEPPATLPSVAALVAARERRWVAEESEDPGHYRLTPAGREALRRSRTRLAAFRAHLRCTEAGASSDGTPSAIPAVDGAESPLVWLAGRRDAAGRPMLSPSEVQAGERLRADLSFAHLVPRVTMGWSGIPISGDRGASAAGFGRDLADNVIAARARVSAALKAVGPELSDILVDVCGHLRGLEEIARAEGWPRRAARLLLQRALSSLARHYGLEPEIRVEETIARRLRHWGTEDYRPTLSRWSNGGAQAD
jgi:hypothetical protein